MGNQDFRGNPVHRRRAGTVRGPCAERHDDERRTVSVLRGGTKRASRFPTWRIFNVANPHQVAVCGCGMKTVAGSLSGFGGRGWS